jgi:hypothetical protein
VPTTYYVLSSVSKKSIALNFCSSFFGEYKTRWQFFDTKQLSHKEEEKHARIQQTNAQIMLSILKIICFLPAATSFAPILPVSSQTTRLSMTKNGEPVSRTWDVHHHQGSNSNTDITTVRRKRSRQKTKPMPVVGYDANAILAHYDRRPLQVGWRLNSLAFPLLGKQ